MELKILITDPSADYELIDFGEGEKLERYGEVLVVRPDPQALPKKSLPQVQWNGAQAKFSRMNSAEQAAKKAAWQIDSRLPKQWEVALADLKFRIKLSSFKHTGVFPEQVENWKWIEHLVSKTRHSSLEKEERPKVLNLFGYTGGATLAAAKAGAEVVHVDGSKVAIAAAKENAALSDLSEKPIRWILDDAFAFVEREIRRGSKYDAIIMDPPAFGRGPAGEVWKIEEKFLPLLEACKKILTDKPLFVLINGYASGYSALAYMKALEEMMKTFGGKVEGGELAIKTKNAGLLPAGIFARWFAGSM